MNRIFKKLLASIMVAAMVLTVAPLSGFVGLKLNLDWLNTNAKASEAETISGECGPDAYWVFNISTGLLNICGVGDTYDYPDNRYSPWTINGISQKIICVNIEYGITSIGEMFFAGCKNLTEVIIPDTVTKIGFYPFSSCAKLKTIDIPQSVYEIEQRLSEDSGIEYINVDENNSYYSSINGILYNKKHTELICYPSGKTEKSFSVPEGVEIIELFDANKFIENIILPDTTYKIGTNAFQMCNNLESVKSFSNNISYVGEHAFWGCSKLEELIIGNNVTYIGEYAFVSTNLKRNVTQLKIDEISNWCYYESHIEEAIIDSGIKQINVRAFSDCTCVFCMA